MAEPPLKTSECPPRAREILCDVKDGGSDRLQGVVEAPQHKTGEHMRPQMFCRTLASLALIDTKHHGRAVEVPGEGADLLDVGQLGVEGEIANAHVLEHPLAQRCHGGAPVQWNEEVLRSARPSSRALGAGATSALRRQLVGVSLPRQRF